MRIKRLQNPHATAPTAMPALPTPRFDLFYKHDELTQLLRAYAETLLALSVGLFGALVALGLRALIGRRHRM